MKKYIAYLFAGLLILSACNPNKEIYENIKNNTDPYRTDFDIRLTDDDYTTISKLALSSAQTDEEIANAKAIDDYKSFAHSRPISHYAGKFLDQEYIAPDSTSSVKVAYNYSLNEFDSVVSYTLLNNDYTFFGGEIDNINAFINENDPANLLPGFINSLDTNSNYIYHIKSKLQNIDVAFHSELVNMIDTILIPNDTLIVQNDTIFTNYDTLYYEHEISILVPDTTYSNKNVENIFIKETGSNWINIDNAVILSNEDYDNMGSPGPGQHNNFSEDYPPENYIPDYLSKSDYYDNVYVVYKYYAGSTETKVDHYQYLNNKWVCKEEHADQFVHNGTQWLFDPTVRYTMVKSDYDILVQYIKNHPDLKGYMDNTYDNTEYYYGASAYYDNFDMRISKRQDNDSLNLLEGLTDNEVKEVLVERLKEGIGIFLEIRFPEAQPVSNGVQVYYEIYYATYEPGSFYYKMRFMCTDIGKFEYDEGPVSVE